MILPISNFSDKKISFSANDGEGKKTLDDKDTLLENNLSNKSFYCVSCKRFDGE